MIAKLPKHRMLQTKYMSYISRAITRWIYKYRYRYRYRYISIFIFISQLFIYECFASSRRIHFSVIHLCMLRKLSADLFLSYLFMHASRALGGFISKLFIYACSVCLRRIYFSVINVCMLRVLAADVYACFACFSFMGTYKYTHVYA